MSTLKYNVVTVAWARWFWENISQLICLLYMDCQNSVAHYHIVDEMAINFMLAPCTLETFGYYLLVTKIGT